MSCQEPRSSHPEGHPAEESGAINSWRIALSPSAWVMEDWETFSALYERDSGDTHLLSALPAEVFSLLAQSPCNERKLLERLAAEHRLEADAALADKVRTALSQLRDLKLIAKAPE